MWSLVKKNFFRFPRLLLWQWPWQRLAGHSTFSPLGSFLYSFSLPSPLPVSTNWFVSFCFVLHLPVSRFSSINTELSVTGVTIGSCRYSVEGHRSVYRFQLLKCYQLPIYNHTHMDLHGLTCTKTHTYKHTLTLFSLHPHHAWSSLTQENLFW